MIRFMKYLVLNGIIAALLWLGLVEGIQGAQNLGIFAIWVLSILSLFFGAEDVAKGVAAKGGFGAPYWFDVLWDLSVLSLLVWHGWYITGGAYVIHMLMISVLRSNVKKIGGIQ